MVGYTNSLLTTNPLDYPLRIAKVICCGLLQQDSCFRKVLSYLVANLRMCRCWRCYYHDVWVKLVAGSIENPRIYGNLAFPESQDPGAVGINSRNHGYLGEFLKCLGMI